MFVDPDAALRKLAAVTPAMAEYRDALLANGFSRQEAIEMCLAASAALLAPDYGEQDASQPPA